MVRVVSGDRTKVNYRKLSVAMCYNENMVRSVKRLYFYPRDSGERQNESQPFLFSHSCFLASEHCCYIELGSLRGITLEKSERYAAGWLSGWRGTM